MLGTLARWVLLTNRKVCWVGMRWLPLASLARSRVSKKTRYIGCSHLDLQPDPTASTAVAVNDDTQV